MMTLAMGGREMEGDSDQILPYSKFNKNTKKIRVNFGIGLELAKLY